MHPRGFTLLCAALLAVGCVPRAVEWDEAGERRPGALPARSQLAWDGGDDAPRIEALWTPPTWPEDAGRCEASLRASRTDSLTFASWFAVRPDSSVLLRVARSDDGGRSWRAAVTADSTDRGLTGCGRPAPAIFVDQWNHHVQVAYHIAAAEGAGIFFTHSMDLGDYFHAPVQILYGDRPAATAMVSRGDTVAVAFEDPNSRFPRVGLAISTSQGHIFEHRLAASDETGAATAPLVAFRGVRIAVAWTVAQAGSGAPRTAIRFGTLAF